MSLERLELIHKIELFVEGYYLNECNLDLPALMDLLNKVPNIVENQDVMLITEINNYLNQIFNCIANNDHYRIIDILDGVIVELLKVAN